MSRSLSVAVAVGLGLLTLSGCAGQSTIYNSMISSAYRPYLYGYGAGRRDLTTIVLGNPFIVGSTGLSGSGSLNRFGNGQVVIAATSDGYTGAITVNGTGGNSNNALLRSQVATAAGKPFGTGAITVNPGGVLSIANPNNLSSNSSVTFNSDRNGLATLALARPEAGART